ncbi:acyl-CoA dehydrogenase family protein [Azospirillum doebereinerae]
MDFNFTKAQRDVYETAGRIGREVLAPNARRHDEEASLPLDALKILADEGFLKLTVPAAYGGLDSGAKGSDPLLYLLAIEQLARYCHSTAHCLQVHSHGAHYVSLVGSAAQKDEILGRVVAEGAILNGTGSEPGRSARGLYGLLTAADRVDGGYRINGIKNYATLADIAAYNIVFLRLRDVPSPEGHLGVAIPQGTDGFHIVEGSWKPIGMRGAVSPTLELRDLFVADRHVLGPPGANPSIRYQAKCHLGFAAQFLGATEALFDYLKAYLPERGTAKDPYAQLRMGELRVGIEATRWIIYRAAWLWTQGDETRAELAAMEAKHQAIENATVAMDRASQIAGSSAYLEGSPFARIVRDLRFQTLHENSDRTSSTIGQAYLGQSFDTTARL